MSVRAMARVWEGSRHSGSELLMLLAIADFADDNGRAYPSITTLAAKCRTKPRYAMVLLEALNQSGELEIRKQAGPMGRGGRTNLYRVVFDKLTGIAEVVNQSALVNQGAVVHQGSGSSAPGFREVVNQGAPKPSGTVRTTKEARKRAGSGFDASLIELPEWLPRESWLAWVADRKERRKPITQRAAEAQIKTLDGYRAEGHTPAAVIANSIAAGYQGLFPPKQTGGVHPQGQRSGGDLLDCDHVFGGPNGRA